MGVGGVHRSVFVFSACVCAFLDLNGSATARHNFNPDKHFN